MLELENITAEYVLNKVDELSIFRYFYKANLLPGVLYRSPFRKDEHPSFSIFATSKPNATNKYLYKDFGTGEVGNCFNFVGKLYDINFNQTLRLILESLTIQTAKKFAIRQESVVEEKDDRNNILSFELNIWNDWNLLFWNKFGINKQLLKYYNVNPVNKFSIRKNGNYDYIDTYRTNNPIFLYTFRDSGKASSYGFKIYRPGKKMYKFIRDYSLEVIEGFEQAIHTNIHTDLCIITKSLKDCMVLRMLGYVAVSPASETTMLYEKTFKILQEKYKNFVILFDNDQAGALNSTKYNQKYGYKEISIPFNTGCKDISDYVKATSLLDGKILLNNLLHGKT